jgi:hypothetical protein
MNPYFLLVVKHRSKCIVIVVWKFCTEKMKDHISSLACGKFPACNKGTRFQLPILVAHTNIWSWIMV